MWAVVAAAAPLASAEPSAVIQYSADVPSADGGDPNAGAGDRLPTTPREVFERVPARDVYALSQIAISPELGGRGGIAGVTGPAYAGPGQSYPAEDVNVAEALFGSLGAAAFLAFAALAAAIAAAAVVAGRRKTATPGV
jgi:hypothetical protein